MADASHANSFAFLVLASWPFIAAFFYFLLPIGRATLWTIFVSQMLLPVGAEIKFPGVPALDKTTIPNIAVLIGWLLLSKRRRTNRTRASFVEVLIAVYVLSPFVTAALNNDVVHLATRTLPAESYYDAISAATTQLISILPFFVGRSVLSTSRDVKEFMLVLAAFGLVYSIPLLFEIRMSPQLHMWVYGYSPTDFIQSVRDGGNFRPMAFMGHGLTAAFFVMISTGAAAALWKLKTRVSGLPAEWATGYLALLLVLCRSFAAIIYGGVIVPLIHFVSARVQIRIALIIVVFALSYPLLRTVDLVPIDLVFEVADVVSPERAASMRFRFVNESALLERASERPFFGWGRFGRSRFYDQDSGRDMSVTDGRWTIALGQFGFVGFLAEFGLLAFGVFRCQSAMRFTSSPDEGILLGALALIVAFSMLNLLPNGALLASTWLLAGALLGRAEDLAYSGRQRSIRSLKLHRSIEL